MEYLIAVIALICGVIIVSIYYKSVLKKKDAVIGKYVNLADKHMELYMLMNQWVKNYQQGKKLEDYFASKNIKTIAIYGMNYVGQTLYDELKKTEVKPLYGIDRNYKKIYAEIDVVSPEDTLLNVDAIVVTSITFFEEIKGNLSNKTNAEIINLFDAVFDI